MNDRYDPRILQRKEDAMSFPVACNGLIARDENAVAAVIDRLVGEINGIEEAIRSVEVRMEPALTPEMPAPGPPPSANVGPRAPTSPLVDSIRNQCERLAALSSTLCRVTNRLEL